MFLKGEAISTFWNLSTKCIGLLNTFLTITSLTLYQYGVFQLLLSFSGIPSDFLNLGSAVVSNEISRSIADRRLSDAKRIFIEYSIFRLIISFVVWLVFFFGATYFFTKYDIDFIKDMRIISFLLISEGIFSVVKMYCLVVLEFSVISLRYTINKFIQSLILIYFFVQGNLGLKQLILSIVIASAVSTTLILFRFFKLYFKWSNIEMTKRVIVWNIFLTYGSWDVFRQISNKITFRIKPWLIKLYIGTEAVAIFSIAETMITTLQDVLPSNTLQSLVPLWIRDKARSIRMFSYGVKYFAFAGVIMALISLLIVPPVVHIYFSKYNASLPFFYLMLINLPIFASGIMIGNYIIALRKQKYLFFLHILRNLLSILFITVTIPLIGLWGLALESVIIPFVMVVTTYLYTKNKNHDFHFDLSVIFSFNSNDREILSKVKFIILVWINKITNKVRSV